MSKQQIQAVKGSVLDVAQKRGLQIEEALMEVDVIVMLDWSGSMGMNDAVYEGKTHTRYEAARLQLEDLQGQHPGRVALVCWAETAEFVPSGNPEDTILYGGGTHLKQALDYVKPYDGTGIAFFLITDGVFHDSWEAGPVADGFETEVTGIFVGAEGDRGFSSLMKMCARTGGKAMKAKKTGLFLEEAREILLLTDNGS